MAKGKPLGLFDDEDEKITAYEATAKAKQDAQAAQTETVESAAADTGTELTHPAVVPADSQDAQPTAQTVQAEPKRVGRPRTAQDRVQFALMPRKDVRRRMKIAAFEHDTTASAVLDALVDQFLDRLDWDTVSN